MTRLIKFGAVLLVSILLAGPASAVGSCLVQSLAANHCVSPCQMMIGPQSGSQIAAQPLSESGPCCQVSSPPALSINSPSANQNRRSAQPHQFESADQGNSLPLLAQAAFSEVAPPTSNSSRQAVLCTFLI